MNGDIKIGRLLCDEDIITKRQLNQALQTQVKGDKRTLGEILVDRGFCSLDDITEVILKHGNGHEEKQEEISSKIEGKEEEKQGEPMELSEEKVLGTKFTLSVQTMIAAGTGLASLIGMWYALQADIQEAKELPVPPPAEITRMEFDMKDQLVRQTIMTTQEDVKELKESIKRLEEKIDKLR